MEWLSRLSVRRPVTTMMVFLALIVLGMVSLRQLPVQLLPDITVPTIGVFLGQPGSSGAETLEELTKPAEGILAELPRVTRIRSWTGSWGTWLQADFEYGTDIRFATIDLQERLNAFQQTLDDRRTSIEVWPFTTTSFKNMLMEISLEGPDDPAMLRDLVRDRVEPQLETISGVARVEIGGLTTEAAEVMIDPARLSGYRLDFGSVFGRIQAAGVSDNYLGRLRVPGETHFVRMDAPVRTMTELRRLPVDGNGIVMLEDVADVEEGEALDSWVYRSNGKNAVGINIEREEGENLIRVAHLVRERIAEVNKTLPTGTSLEIRTDIAEIVEEVIGEVKSLAFQGAILALLVPLVFFRSWRISLIIFLSVPICIAAVFNLFYAAGMSINVFSIVGLALGVGMLVDNSIVVVENCFRLYFSRRMGAIEASEKGGGDVGRALLASTLTTVVPFVALFFIEGEFRLFIVEPALALSFPLLLSLLVALSLSAMLTSKALATIVRHSGAQGAAEFARAAENLNPARSRMREFYRWLLKGAIRHRWRVLLAIGAMLAVVWFEACEAVRQSTTDREQSREWFQIYVQTPPGSKTGETAVAVQMIEKRLAEHEDFKRFSVWFRGDEGNFDIQLKKKKDRPSGRSLEEIRDGIVEFVGDVPGAEVSLDRRGRPAQREFNPPGDSGQIVLSGLDYRTIEAQANRVIAAIEVLPDVARARIQKEEQQPEYHAVVDRERTKQFGVDAQSLGQYVGATRSAGAISSLELRDGDRRTDVTISVADAEVESVAAVRDMPVYTQKGATVPMGDLTTFRTHQAPADARREDRQSSLVVEYFWPKGADQAKLKESIAKILVAIPNPAGISAEFGGQQAELEKRDADFQFVLLVGVLLIYVVMAAVFESFWVPFTILATNPLMLIGIVMALAITGLPFEELAGFGVILLNGLAVNNGIVLMDAALSYRRDHGYRPLRAIFQASDQRLRPIVMTFLTTTLGLLPMALSGDDESQWKPVAVVVIGGLTSATLLTLVVLPCFYLMGDDFVRFARPRWLSLLAAIFRALEWIGNTATRALVALAAFWHWSPRTWPRRAWASAKVAARFACVVAPKAAWRGLRIGCAATWRLLKSAAGDVAFLARMVAGKSDRAAAPAIVVPRPDVVPAAEVPVTITNLQVIFPLPGLPSPRLLIPTKGIPIGHRPKTGLRALQGVDLSIGNGLYGLLGPNGAGKTTLMRCIAGLEEPARGTVRIFGRAHREAGESLAPLIGYLPQSHGHYDWMTLRQYLDHFATLTARTRRIAEARVGGGAAFAGLVDLSNPATRRAAVADSAAQVHLDEFLDERIGAFSGGMRQRAGIARVLLQAPPIVIVDEPTAGLDPVERVKVRLLLGELARTRCVLFSTHIVEDLEDACTRVGVLDRGRLLFDGPPAELRERWASMVWQVPLAADESESLRKTLVARGARVLFRYARENAEGWRVLCPTAPHERAVRASVTLEDALLGTLGNSTAGNGPASA